jgi:uncharacterized membrane protein YoaK (UPF0700 family)
MTEGTSLAPARENISLGLLSAASGAMDALSFVRLGHVFTSAMTGNTALLAIAIGQTRLDTALHAFTAFAGFVFGCAGAVVLLGESASRARLSAALAIEAIFVGGFAILWLTLPDRTAVVPLHVLILLSAIGMGLQSVTVRHLNVPGVTTTYFTNTLVSVVSTVMGRSPPDRNRLPRNARLQLGVLAAYGCSAAIAGLAATHGVELIALFPFLAIVVVLAAFSRR